MSDRSIVYETLEFDFVILLVQVVVLSQAEGKKKYGRRVESSC